MNNSYAKKFILDQFNEYIYEMATRVRKYTQVDN